MLRKRIVAGILVIMLIATGTAAGCVAKTGSYSLSAAWCQDIANKITATQPEEIPGSIAQDTMGKTGDEFDVNTYFKIFTDLSLKKGYLLDYVYYLSGAGGTPVLYTRQKDQPSFYSYSDFAIAGTKITRPENDISLIWLTVDKNKTIVYGNQINIKNSAQGYFEYALLQMLGGQFYLYYKANIYDVRLVATPSELDTVLQSIDTANLNPIDDDFKARARTLNLEPAVDIQNDTVQVSMVVFTMWGGFSRAVFTINRAYPNTITKYENTVLLKYDSGLKL